VSRLSLSDVAEMLLAQAERDRAEREQLTGLLKEVVAGLTAPRPVTASESVTIKRAGIGDKPTTIDVSAVVQEGETLEDARRRASIEYEKAAARFPLPNGYAHAAPLGDEENPRQPLTLAEQLEDSLPDGAK
jgi:hypothetical protein